MPEKNDILYFLKSEKDSFRKLFSVRKIGLFGSFVRGDNKAQSDIDLLVEFDEPTFDHYMDLKFYIEDKLGLSIDLVISDALKPRLRPHIEREVIYA